MTAVITDFNQFAGLKASADRNDPRALREVASQFEALFVQTLMKNMRGAELAEPILGGGEQDRMYQEMLDKQLSLEISGGRGIGLADMLVRQLGGGVADVPVTTETHMAPVRRVARMDGAVAALPDWSGADEFAEHVWPHAERAAARLGVAPEALLAQAALETGWGEHVMRHGNGSSSYNLFGVKAGTSWQGDSVARRTLEYEDGIARRTVARFRAYPDLAATFDDYVDLISDNPRYSAVPGHGSDVQGFAAALQQAGYATDPAYAAKIDNVLHGETMQQAIAALKAGGARPITSVHASTAP